MQCFLTTYWGDLTVERESSHCLLVTDRLTIEESAALRKVLKKFHAPEPESLAPQRIRVDAGMDEVVKYLNRVLKRGEPILQAARYAGGKVEEAPDLAAAEAAGAEVAVATEVPRRGCPMPAFDPTREAEIRATRVLEEFMSPMQRADWNRLHAIGVKGADTGRRYVIAHRHSRRASSQGIVFDLDRKRSCCVEASQLRAAEEVLALMLTLELRGRERAWLDAYVD